MGNDPVNKERHFPLFSGAARDFPLNENFALTGFKARRIGLANRSGFGQRGKKTNRYEGQKRTPRKGSIQHREFEMARFRKKVAHRCVLLPITKRFAPQSYQELRRAKSVESVSRDQG